MAMKFAGNFCAIFFLMSLIAVFGIEELRAQEKMGIVHDNYLPLHQRRLNPAAIVDQKPWISINIFGAAAYANGNFVYFPEDRISPSTTFETVQFNSSGEIIKGFVVGEFMGPSASISIGRSSVALHTAMRSYTAIDRVPAVIGQLVTDESAENIQDGIYEMKRGRGKTMSWAEVGITYGQILSISGKSNTMLSAAIGINRIFGIQQASFIVEEAELEVENAKGEFRYAKGKYSYARPQWMAGKGWGMNLGITYKKMIDNVDGYTPHSQRGGCQRLNYRYKIGLSVIDLGKVRYSKDAFFAQITEDTELDEMENVVEDESVESEELKREGFEYSASMPTAASLQLDYSLGYGLYLNGTILQNLTSPNNFGVERANLLALTPRYEKRRYSISLPLSLADYTQPQIGLAVRFGPLSIGSDHIIPFLTETDIYGADIYFNFSMQIFSSPWCKQKNKGNYEKWICPAW